MTTRQKLEKGVSPVGIAVWPRLNTPDTKFKEDGEYSCAIRLNADNTTTKEFLRMVDETYDRETARLKGTLSPKQLKSFKMSDKPYSEEMDEDGNGTGSIIVRFKMRASGERADKTRWERRPNLFDAKLKPLPAGTNVGGGSRVRVSYEILPYATQVAGIGISLRLQGVQVLDLVEFGGRTGKDMGFSEEEGFTSDDAPADLQEANEQAEAKGTAVPDDF